MILLDRYDTVPYTGIKMSGTNQAQEKERTMNETVKKATKRAKHLLKTAMKNADDDTPVALALVKEAMLLLAGAQAMKKLEK